MHQLPRPLFLWHLKVDFTTARWDFWSSPQSPPLISAFEWTFELQVGASSRPSSWQQTILRCGKKVGWLLCFAMFFLPNYLIGNSRPVLPSSATPRPWLSKPHAPRCALPTDSIQQQEKEAGQLTMQAVRIAIFIGQLFNWKSSCCPAIFCNSPPLRRTNPTSHAVPSRGFNPEPP